MRVTIEVKYEVRDLPGIVIDKTGAVWRKPYYGKNGRKYKAKRLNEIYERRYTAYRINNRYYSTKWINANRIPRKYTLIYDI